MATRYFHFTAKFAVAVLIACHLTGCRSLINDTISKSNSSIPRPTDSLREEHYQKWPRDIRNAVDKRFLLLRMDKVQAQVAMEILESSITRQTSATTNSTIEVWTVWRSPGYWSATPGGESQVALTFTDGLLTGIRRVSSKSVAPPPGQYRSAAPTRANPTPQIPKHPSFRPPQYPNQRPPIPKR